MPAVEALAVYDLARLGSPTDLTRLTILVLEEMPIQELQPSPAASS
jgi:hypothetical protein